MNGFRRFKKMQVESSHIGTLVVVEKRAVIEDQAQVRLVVAKDIIAKDLTFREVLGQI